MPSASTTDVHVHDDPSVGTAWSRRIMTDSTVIDDDSAVRRDPAVLTARPQHESVFSALPPRLHAALVREYIAGAGTDALAPSGGGRTRCPAAR